ncbi:Sn1-specific diacylglycerol lipase alpha [Ananas comosus]|uniref:Sn1-specific diacylglycerol lipase alpha n=1 Tax=Ananas comosus TaxID=4615 RepID=A0A199V3B2_ANACO|nr:Sn1-specific diacylglycerol lipase alpha [Ananas comosus]
MGDSAAGTATLLANLRAVRWVSLVLGFGNVCLVLIGACLVLSASPSCSGGLKLSFVFASLAAGARMAYMVSAARAQRATAETIISHVSESSVAADSVVRHERRMRYKRWLWWTRFGMFITTLQFIAALYLMGVVAKDLSSGEFSKTCFSGQDSRDGGWKHTLLITFLVLVWLVVIIQCITGSDVLRWRSVLEDDEVYSVARLLGDLMVYRASGTGHLELLAGLALLQKHKQSPVTYSESLEAPEARIQEAALFHQFAEAAYTGPLLDFGRNPVLFPCVWLYRQGALTPWTCRRRPILEGDNWWRGHAAAFLKYVNLPPEALRRGRVSQTKREAAYFVVVLHDLKTVVIAVRGTETPEDLITDGLCRDSDQLPRHVRDSVLSSFPHYGHSGIVESARELFMKIDGQPGDKDEPLSEITGFLSSLLGMGGECHGYAVRIVGHSLGGSVAALLGMRLYGRYPDLHVYSYGTLPCVDSVVAEACSDIIYNDEFSARLSVNSIIRLRAAAVRALSNDCSGNSAIISKLVRKILNAKKYNQNGDDRTTPNPSIEDDTEIVEYNHQIHKSHLKYTIKGGVFLCGHAVSCVMNTPNHRDSSNTVDAISEGRAQNNQELHYDQVSSDYRNSNALEGASALNNPVFLQNGFSSFPDNASQVVDDALSMTNVSGGDLPEMYLPGLIIHIVPIPAEKGTSPFWKSWIATDSNLDYKAFVANKESFRDLVVSPYMFLDHIPWRCQHAMQRVLESRRHQGQLSYNSLEADHIV